MRTYHLRHHKTVFEVVKRNFVVMCVNLQEPRVQHLHLSSTSRHAIKFVDTNSVKCPFRFMDVRKAEAERYNTEKTRGEGTLTKLMT